MSARADDDLAAPLAGARRAAILTLLVGLSVAAIVVLFVSLGAVFLFGSGPGARPASPSSSSPRSPEIIGFPILIGATMRLHALRTLERCFAGGGITIITGERDRDTLTDAARARASVRAA